MKRRWKVTIAAAALSLGIVGVYAANPPVSDIHINGHTYTNAQLEANPAGWIAGIANDIAAVTQLYPQGRFAPRTRLTSDLDLYVTPVGSDAGNCLVGQPCASIQRPFDVLRDLYDFGGFTVTVHVADGTYQPGLKLRARMVGQQSPASLVLQGNSANPAAVSIIDPAVPTGLFEQGNGTALYTNWGGMITVNGVRLVGGFRCLWANDHSNIRFLNVEIGNSGSGTQIAASHFGIIRLRGNYKINGNASRSSVLATDGGQVLLSDVADPDIFPVITLVGTPTLGSFAEAQRNGMILSRASQTVFVGGSTGQKFSIDTQGLITTNGSGPNYFPGTVAGVISVGTGANYE